MIDLIEKTIAEELSDSLSCEVVFERDGQKPPFVLVEKTGSSRVNFLESSTFAFQSYGRTMLEAIELNEEVKEAVFDLIRVPTISASKLSRDYNFTDTTTEEYRYQAIFDIYYMKGEA